MSEDQNSPDESVQTKVVARRGRKPAVETTGADLSGAVKARGGRKAQVRPETEDDSPIDGDINGRLELDPSTLDPAFEYHWLNAFALEQFGWRGYVAEEWGPKCARPKLFFGNLKPGEQIRCRELTLYKIPKRLMDRIRKGDPRRRTHLQALQAVGEQARESGGQFTHTVTYV